MIIIYEQHLNDCLKHVNMLINLLIGVIITRFSIPVNFVQFPEYFHIKTFPKSFRLLIKNLLTRFK